MPQPILRFRLYPEHKALYFIVRVWRTRQDLQDAISDWDVVGQCSSEFIIRVYPDGRQRLKPHLGRIDLSMEELDSDVIAHELMHAVFRWAERKGINIMQYPEEKDVATAMEVEERLCYAHSHMMIDVERRIRTIRDRQRLTGSTAPRSIGNPNTHP